MKVSAFIVSLVLMLVLSASGPACVPQTDTTQHRYTSEQLDCLLKKPVCLEGFRPNQSGPLSRIDEKEGDVPDSTFSVEHIVVPSGDIFINGWLYLPEGNSKCPLIIITNGGGNNPQRIRSLPDWLAPILAHCGIAAFVHDKRGTGESGGIFRETTYENYITDAGNCAMFLAGHDRIDPDKIGIAGGSEGGRIAVLAASRYPVFSFVISYAGTVVSAVDDRIYAQKGWLDSFNLNDTAFAEIFSLHEQSIRAWASNDPEKHQKVNERIFELRNIYNNEILPYTKEEMDSLSDFDMVLSTWNSLGYNYLDELEHFNKKWLAIFGENDIVVPTQASIINIEHYMTLNNNEQYWIAVLPDCGHAPVSNTTKQLIRIDNLIINWIQSNIMQ